MDTIAERNVMPGKKAENVAFKIISNQEDLHNFEKLLEIQSMDQILRTNLLRILGKQRTRNQ